MGLVVVTSYNGERWRGDVFGAVLVLAIVVVAAVLMVTVTK